MSEEMERRPRKFVTEDLSDEFVNDFINDGETDEESVLDTDSDHSEADPDYFPDAIEMEIDAAVNQMFAAETTDAFVAAADVDISGLDISAMERQSASSTIVMNNEQQYDIRDNVDLTTQEEIVDLPVIHLDLLQFGDEVIAEGPSKSSTFKPKKRPRSPLPTVESAGPSITPSAGGFIGSGKFITFVLFT